MCHSNNVVIYRVVFGYNSIYYNIITVAHYTL